MTTAITKFNAAVDESGLSPDGVNSLREAFSGYFADFESAALEAKSVGDCPKAARSARMKLKNIRVAAEKTRKELKADSLRRGKAIDGVNNLLLYALKPIEKGMEDIELAEKRRLEAKRQVMLEKRRAAVEQYADPAYYNLEEMDDNHFAGLLRKLKEEHDARIEAGRIAAEKAEREAEEARIAAERAEEERRQREAEREAELERMRVEQAKLQEEREAAEAKARAERKAREQAEAEARRIQEAAEAREREEAAIIAAEEAAKVAAERRRAAAPDREKLSHMARQVRALQVPSLATSKGLVVEIAEQVEKFAAWLEAKAEKLGD